MDPLLGYGILTAVFSAGAAWTSVKLSLNGAKKRIDETHSRLTVHIQDEAQADSQTHERIARVETKVDMILEQMR
jgi:hypothetical protein